MKLGGRKFLPDVAFGLSSFHVIAAYAFALIFVQSYSLRAWMCFVFTWCIIAETVSVGNHRYFTHAAFKCNKVVETILIFAQVIQAQGTIRKWVGYHDVHHVYTDRAGDPHRPSEFGGGLRGLFWAHMGWLVFEVTPPAEYQEPARLRELFKNPLIRWQKYYYLPLMLLYYLALYKFAGWQGPLLGVLAVVFSWHFTWSINSVCHVWGSHAVDAAGNELQTKRARNAWEFFFNIYANIYAFITASECRHANHHARPRSARLGWKWYQLDTGWYAIWLLEFFGLAWDVRRPSFAAVGSE